MKKYAVYSLWALAGLLILVVILYLSAALYVSANKEKLIAKAVSTLGTTTGGTASISDLSLSVLNNFPFVAIELKKVALKDSLFSRHGHHLLFAERLYLRVNPLSLVLGKIAVKKIEMDSGMVYLYTDSTGYSNDYLLKKKTQTTTIDEKDKGSQEMFDKIELKHTALTVDDRSKAKLFDVFVNKFSVTTKKSGSDYIFKISESVLIKSIAFNQAIGSYMSGQTLNGNYSMLYSAAKKELRFDSIPVRITNQPFHFTGVFSFGTVQQFLLRVNANNISVDFAKKLLTEKTAKGISLVSVAGPVDASATLKGSLTGGNPYIVAQWVTKANTLTTPLLSFNNCSFSGSYTNEVNPDSAHTDENSKVEIYQFRGDWRGLTMQSEKMVINNLTIPVLTADLRSDFLLPQFNTILQTEALSLTRGNGSLSLKYKGPFDHITPQNASLNGTLLIRNGNIVIGAAKSNLSDCNAVFHFVNTNVILERLDCRIHNDPIHVSGNAVNALGLLGDTPGNVLLSLNISAPVLNIDNLTSVLYRKLPARKTNVNAKPGSIAQTAQKIDQLLSSGNISVNVNAAKLVYHKFQARNAVASIAIDENSWLLKNASLQHGSGSISVTGKVQEQSAGRFGLQAAMQMKQVDAQKVWYEFENFGIPDLNYKNIKGLLSADARLSLLLDRTGNFDMKTLNGDADFSIRQGALINFKPLQSVRTFVFKNRDFTDIAFAEIKDHIAFNRGTVTIDRMEINSTVMSLFVEGIYGLSGNTDISIQLPLSNLKKRDKDYVPENAGASRGGGMSVFLRAKTDADGTIRIKYDPFKRFRKSPGK